MKRFLLSNQFELSELSEAVGGDEKTLRNVFMCGFRLLQWLSERLPVDRQSCTMRGMSADDWYNACQLLMSARIIDSNSRLLLPLPHALSRLWTQLDAALGDTDLRSNSSQKSTFNSDTTICCTSMIMVSTLVNRKA